jgi:hypothetical protein
VWTPQAAHITPTGLDEPSGVDKIGWPRRDRTFDLLNQNQAFYQLNYRPMSAQVTLAGFSLLASLRGKGPQERADSIELFERLRPNDRVDAALAYVSASSCASSCACAYGAS